MPKKVALVVLLACMVSAAAAREKYQNAGPVRLDRDGDKWAQKTLRKLSLEQKIGQMLVVWARAEFLNLSSADYQRLRDLARRYHIGAFGLTVRTDGRFVLRNQPFEAAVVTNQLQREAELPLLFAADFERGLAMRLYGVSVFPAAMAFGANGSLADAESFGRITGEEARAIGVQWNWFPVADVNSNPVNPIINTRAFGEDPQAVGELVAAYIKGAHEAGMLTTAKHFPGHGDTATDSHLGLARVGGDEARLRAVELPPFQKAIEAGVDSVMVAHVTVPALEPDPNKVASTSPAIVSGLLKRQMGFQGLVVTDALEMNALMRMYAGAPNPSGAAAVAAVKAGNDMVLIPADVEGAFNGLLNAVKSGEISQAQVDGSVLKILRAKASVGLHKARLVDLDALDKIVGHPNNVAAGQRMADAAVTLVRDGGQVLPIRRRRGTPEARNPYLGVSQTSKSGSPGAPRSSVVAVVFNDDVRAEAGRVLERELRARVPDAAVFIIDPRLAGGMAAPVLAAVEQAEVVIAAMYAVPVSGKAIWQNGELKNSVALAEPSADLMRRILQRAGPRTVVVALGNPYLAADFPEVQTYVCTFSNETVSELSAVKALFGEIAIRGRLPVSIPSVAQRGYGLDRPQQVLEGGLKGNVSSKTAAAP